MDPNSNIFASKVFIIALVLLSTAFHEMAHAFTATYFGDPTPGRNGRLTLNPIPHLQPVFTAVILPVIMFLTSGILLGLATTPIDPSRFRRPLRDHALVALAGPVTNLFCAAVLIGILWIPGVWQTYGPVTVTMYALKWSAFMNLLLAAFNLMPLPPLDGYWILRSVLPLELRMQTDGFARSPFSFILVLIVGGQIVSYFDAPLARLLGHLLPQ